MSIVKFGEPCINGIPIVVKNINKLKWIIIIEHPKEYNQNIKARTCSKNSFTQYQKSVKYRICTLYSVHDTAFSLVLSL